MSESITASQIDHLLAATIQETASSPALANLHYELAQARERLKQPMHVAIIGLIKAGKSTAMNALLGDEVVPTGTIETTFNVNWLCYSEQKSLEVHYKDRRPVEVKAFSELGTLTRRTKEYNKLLRSIKYIKVLFPNEMLHTLQLIDTPGLESVYEDDSQNTRDFINAHGRELAETTRTEASQADAVLYLFSKSISASAEDTIKEFQGPVIGSATPINSIGVLTKVDFYWPSEPDPLESGTRVVKRLQSDHPQVNRLLYAITPVSGLLALGAQTITSQEDELLGRLAALPDTLLRRRLRDARRFTEENFDDVPVSPQERATLLNRLGQYGIWKACQYIGVDGYDLPQLKAALLVDSGMQHLHDLIISHFGNRAYLIKLESVLRNIAATIFRLRQNVKGTDLEILRKVSRTIEELETQQEDIRELRVLRSYYEGKLTLNTTEVQQLLQVTGENGMAYWQRLGIAEEENITTMERLEKALIVAMASMRHWRQRAIDPSLDRDTRNATQVIARAYDRIIYHLREAQRHLSLSL